MFPKIRAFVDAASQHIPPIERQSILEEIENYIRHTGAAGLEPKLHFICTHNSRRSQFSQVWAHVLAHMYGLPLAAYSGGVEVTACNDRVIRALEEIGFEVKTVEPGDNPVYSVYFHTEEPPILLFSKMYDDPRLPTREFAAIMTCSEADENCPFIPGAQKRIPLRYEDPKIADNTPSEMTTYLARAKQIASELDWMFRKVVQQG